MTNFKQRNVKDIFSYFWKHTKRNEKINETTNWTILSCSIWRNTVVQLINGLDFVFLCVAVWLCAIENQSLKKKKKAFEPRKNLHHNIYLQPFYWTLKAAIIVYNQLRFFFCYEDDEIISWIPSVKQSTLKRMKRNILGILSSLTFK